MNLKRLFLALVAVIAGAALLPGAAQAQVRQCRVTATSPPAVATYDPFNPAPLNVASVAVNFVRDNPQGGTHPTQIDFYIRSSNPAANGIQLIPISITGATGSGGPFGSNIFYPTTGPFPPLAVPLPASPIPGVFRYNFSGNNAASDIFTVNFSITFPANLNLAASTNLVFDIEYGCDGTGGGGPFSERNVAPNAFTISVNVLSGAQASYSGPALDFGEVGNLTDVQAAAIGPPSGTVRVASSGPFTISMESDNDYRMTYPSGNPAVETANLRYQVTFMGQTRDPSNFSAISRTCERAGLGSPPLAAGTDFPVSVQLLEGGTDEQPSSSYSDTLVVTVTPLAGNNPSGLTCPT